MTAEEMLVAHLDDTGETLMHFNKYHDPNTGQFTSGTLRTTTIKTKPTTMSQKEINKFNNKAMGLVDKISDRALKASGLYTASMAMAKKRCARRYCK